MLCWTCYYRPAVRALYPIDSKFAVKGQGLREPRHPQPAQATQHLPGTEGKIAAMTARIARGEPLYHPQDATEDLR